MLQKNLYFWTFGLHNLDICCFRVGSPATGQSGNGIDSMETPRAAAWPVGGKSR